ncbi:hypothetical protein MJT46_018211 [Ovis ammon polii x Ovis aries]|nr:hypothetical protein MJT46_018211 [Ovis ammon polii x Ovis aries]
MGGAAAPPGDQVGPLRLQETPHDLKAAPVLDLKLSGGLHPAQGCGGPESRRVKMKDTTQPKLRSLDKILRYTKDQCLSPGGKEQDAVSRALSIAWKAVVPLDPSGPRGGSGTLAAEAKRVALGKKKNQPFFSFYYKEMRRDISGVEQKASDVLTCRVSLLIKGPLTISHTVRARWHLLCVRLYVIVHLQVGGPLAQTIWDLTPSFLTVTPGDFLRLPKFGNTWPFHGLGKLPEVAVGKTTNHKLNWNFRVDNFLLRGPLGLRLQLTDLANRDIKRGGLSNLSDGLRKGCRQLLKEPGQVL